MGAASDTTGALLRRRLVQAVVDDDGRLAQAVPCSSDDNKISLGLPKFILVDVSRLQLVLT